MFHRRSLLRALSAAPLVALPLTACATTSTRASDELKVVSFNIWHDREDWPARMPLVIETLRAADADVIGLQEVLEDAATGLPNQARTIAQALGGYDVEFVSTDAPGAPRRYGNAILSRRPIVARDWVKLEPLDDYRTAVRIRIDAGGRPLDVVNTHWHHTPEGAAIRARQADHLLRWLPSGPVVLMGDFNAPLEDSGLDGLRRAGFVSALPAGTVSTTLNTAEGHPLRVIDHIFVRPDQFRVEATGVIGDVPSGETFASDHFAVQARLRRLS